MASDDFRKLVKKRLVDLGWTQQKLNAEITAETGLYCDDSLLKRIFDGKVHSEKVVSAIHKILDIDYEPSADEMKLQILDERTVLNKDFRVYGTPDEPLFLAKDVANWIEHTNITHMMNIVDDNEKLTYTICNSGQNREMWFLTEDGLYEVLMQSRKPIAKAFKKEVKKILKTIRTHGMYATDQLLDNPEFAIQVFTQLKEERARRKELETENEIQRQALCDAQPKLEYYDTILASTGTLTTSQIAADYDISARALNKILHDAHLQYNVNGQWILYREHMGLGYTRSKTISIVRSDGRPDTKLSTQWTQKGRLKIHEILTARGIRACMDRQESETT